MPAKRTITDVKEQYKRPDRVSIYLDGKFWKGLNKEVAISLNLQKNLKIDSANLEKIVFLEEKKKALDYSFKLLKFRNRSVKELENRLRNSGFTEEVLREVIRELKQQGYLNDLLFTRMWISERFRLKNIGRNRVRHELLTKGLDKSIIDEELSGYSNEEEKERALILARKKSLQNRNLDPIKQRQRLYQFLIYKGFDVSIAAEVSRKIFQLEDENCNQGDY